jgi:hypothetical protein
MRQCPSARNLGDAVRVMAISCGWNDCLRCRSPHHHNERRAFLGLTLPMAALRAIEVAVVASFKCCTAAIRQCLYSRNHPFGCHRLPPIRGCGHPRQTFLRGRRRIGMLRAPSKHGLDRNAFLRSSHHLDMSCT